nr:MAG TPA: hypothetical protein [Caudoviricetes sp.]
MLKTHPVIYKVHGLSAKNKIKKKGKIKMFISVQGKIININYIVIVEKIDANSAKIFLSHQNEPIEVPLSYASILGKIHRALGILEEEDFL